MNLQINLQSQKTMESHAERIYPNECCGFLFGTEGKIRAIDQVLEVANNQLGDQRKRFEISPVDYMKAERYAVENDLDLLGIYHSHPDHPAIPSKHDFRQAVPFFSYIILSVRHGQSRKITSWRLNEDNEFEQEKVSIEKPQLINA